MTFAFGGIVLIGFSKTDTDQKESSDQDNQGELSPQLIFQIGFMLTLLAAVGCSIVNVASRYLRQVNFAIIQFNYALMASSVMGISLFAFYLRDGKIPFIYNSWFIYLEILIASFLNMVG